MVHGPDRGHFAKPDTLLQIRSVESATRTRRSALAKTGRRYSWSMRIPAVLILFALYTGAAPAQPGGAGAQRVDRQLDHEQLRGDLRGAVRPQRVSGSGATIMAAADPPPAVPARHLSVRERAELRQQLRQEQAGARKANP